ncbi:hypothetical protein AB0F72_10240 [Actinoplanes sp. NPDC023936]|uniref:hypothetical protein n=1 Tax=Actinoplanes sp. NPDC023936 TaxID=3154910 RepID=UPI0033D74378
MVPVVPLAEARPAPCRPPGANQPRLEDLARRQSAIEATLAQTRQQTVVTEETALLQEAGIYQHRHPLPDAVAYQTALARVQSQVKTEDGAVQAARSWTVNGSEAQGRTMLRDYSKLMLRAYNAEADNLVRGLKLIDAAISCACRS